MVQIMDVQEDGFLTLLLNRNHQVGCKAGVRRNRICKCNSSKQTLYLNHRSVHSVSFVFHWPSLQNTSRTGLLQQTSISAWTTSLLTTPPFLHSELKTESFPTKSHQILPKWIIGLFIDILLFYCLPFDSFLFRFNCSFRLLSQVTEQFIDYWILTYCLDFSSWVCSLIFS